MDLRKNYLTSFSSFAIIKPKYKPNIGNKSSNDDKEIISITSVALIPFLIFRFINAKIAKNNRTPYIGPIEKKLKRKLFCKFISSYNKKYLPVPKDFDKYLVCKYFGEVLFT